MSSGLLTVNLIEMEVGTQERLRLLGLCVQPLPCVILDLVGLALGVNSPPRSIVIAPTECSFFFKCDSSTKMQGPRGLSPLAPTDKLSLL